MTLAQEKDGNGKLWVPDPPEVEWAADATLEEHDEQSHETMDPASVAVWQKVMPRDPWRSKTVRDARGAAADAIGAALEYLHVGEIVQARRRFAYAAGYWLDAALIAAVLP